MIPGLEQTPPIVAWALGFFMALSLKRGRIERLISRFVPVGDKD
jgi:hypothetical protein